MFENETQLQEGGLVSGNVIIMSLSSVVCLGRCGYWEAAPQTGVVIAAAQSREAGPGTQTSEPWPVQSASAP